MLFAAAGEYEPCGLFTIDHLKLIIITILGIIIALKKTAKKTKEEIKHIIKRCTITTWIFEILIISFKLGTGSIRDVNNYVPLYYCSLLLYAGALASYAKGKLQRIGKIFLAVGGIAGGLIFIIPTIITTIILILLELTRLSNFPRHGLLNIRTEPKPEIMELW